VDIQLILQHISRGNRQAFAAVVDRYQRPLFSYLGRMGLPQAMAEEIAQETFLRAWQNLGQYDPKRAEFSTWLFTIGRRLALNALERASHRLEVGQEDHLIPGEESEDHNTPQPLERLELQQQQQRLQAALRRLPLHDRSALALAYLQGLDLKTIAAIENCSEAALKVRLHRAREQLRHWLEATDGTA
jgi:RNA polymerase sigma-70 factor (ECF subfamily)